MSDAKLAALRERLERAIHSRASSKWFVHPLTNDDARAILASLAQSPPSEPTETMIIAAMRADKPKNLSLTEIAKLWWAAMYHAATAEARMKGGDSVEDFVGQRSSSVESAGPNAVTGERASGQHAPQPEQAQGVVEEIDAFLADAPKGYAAYRYGELLQRARDELREAANHCSAVDEENHGLRKRIAALEKDLAAARAVIEAAREWDSKYPDGDDYALHEAIRALDAQREGGK